MNMARHCSALYHTDYFNEKTYLAYCLASSIFDIKMRVLIIANDGFFFQSCMHFLRLDTLNSKIEIILEQRYTVNISRYGLGMILGTTYVILVSRYFNTYSTSI